MRTEDQMQYALRVRIVLVIDEVEKRIVEIVSFWSKILWSCGLRYNGVSLHPALILKRSPFLLNMVDW